MIYLIENDKIKEIAKNPAQILLKWPISQNISKTIGVFISFLILIFN
jgi:hypothetical protein